MKEFETSIKKSQKLLDFLIENTKFSKNRCKSLLKYENILVNGVVQSKFDYLLKEGDLLKITATRRVTAPFPIIYEDQEFLVVKKRERLLTVSNDSYERSLFKDAIRYIKAKKSGENLYLVHRLDKETSGIVLFCKSKELTKKLQDNWNQLVRLRNYVAVVEGKLEKNAGTLKYYLEEHQEKNVTVTDELHGQLAITNYQVLKANRDFSLVNIQLETGRKNQIRATFSYLHHPIVGDKKYYSKTNPIHRVCLVANQLEFFHPTTKKLYQFKIPVPKEFLKLVK